MNLNWFRYHQNCKFDAYILCNSGEENDDDNDEENDENMDTAEPAELRPRNPDDEFNFADYDNEGKRNLFNL